MWADSFGKTTYHIRVGKSVKTINSPTIATLIYRGLITEELELTEMGQTVDLV